MNYQLPGHWADALNATIILTDLLPSADLDIANAKIIQAFCCERRLISLSTACLASIHLPRDLDDHVYLLAKSVIKAAHGERWKLERYLVVRGLIDDPGVGYYLPCQDKFELLHVVTDRG